jgi:hypothetical protein
MPLALTLRRRKEVSPFLRQLCRVATAPGGDCLFLCSGFFADFVLDDERLREAIKQGCQSGYVVMIGGMFEDRKTPGTKTDNYKYFTQFVQRLRSDGVDVRAYESTHPHWHGKLAIRLSDSTPLAAIVGSSNLTLPALRESGENWNLESDVTIWLPELNGHFESRDSELDAREFALLNLDERDELNEEGRLADLLQLFVELKKGKQLRKIPENKK